MFLNEDRHTHNIAVLMNSEGKFEYCPIFDNGAGLLSDIRMDYPLEEDIYKQIHQVRAKTICRDFDEQLETSERLYGENLKFYFTKQDVEKVLEQVNIYSENIKKRVENILFEQMRRYQYLFTREV